MGDTLYFRNYDHSDVLQYVLNRDTSFRHMFEIYEPTNQSAKNLQTNHISRDEFIKNFIFDDSFNDIKVPVCYKKISDNKKTNYEALPLPCEQKKFGMFDSGQVSLISLKLPLRDNIFNLFWAIEKIKNKSNNANIFKNVQNKARATVNGDFPQNNQGGGANTIYDFLIKKDKALENQAFFQILKLNNDGAVPPQEDSLLKDDYWYYFKVEFYENKMINIPVIVKINKFLILGYMLQTIKTYLSDEPGLLNLLNDVDSDYKTSKYAFYSRSKEYFPKILKKLNKMATVGNVLKQQKFKEIQNALLLKTKNQEKRNSIMSFRFPNSTTRVEETFNVRRLSANVAS